MKRKRKEFTLVERQQVHMMLAKDKGFKEIGKALNRDWRVIKRVSRRYESNNPIIQNLQGPYDRAKWDEDEHRKRLKGAKKRIRLKTRERQEYVENRLDRASPELIAGRYRKEHPLESMSHESIYQWIYKERRDLVSKLEIVSKRGNRKRSSNRKYRYKEPAAPKRSITERPKEADDRTGILHLESDSVMGVKSSKPCVQNICDRKSRIVMLDKLYACNAEASAFATRQRLGNLPVTLRTQMTITEDNGAENSKFAEEEKSLGIKHYSCHPYSAWERGTVENRNRAAVRKCFPKGTDFSAINFDEIKSAETFHNNRPMKCLGFRTPYEVIAEDLEKHNLTPQILGLSYLPW